jgi:hypothetical protein
MTEVRNTYAATVERIAGSPATRWTFTVEALNLDDAWIEARARWRLFGPSSRVVDVHEVPAVVGVR